MNDKVIERIIKIQMQVSIAETNLSRAKQNITKLLKEDRRMNDTADRAIKNLKKIDEWMKLDDITEKRLESLISLKTTYTRLLDMSLCNTIDEYILTPEKKLEKRRKLAFNNYKEE